MLVYQFLIQPRARERSYHRYGAIPGGDHWLTSNPFSQREDELPATADLVDDPLEDQAAGEADEPGTPGGMTFTISPVIVDGYPARETIALDG